MDRFKRGLVSLAEIGRDMSLSRERVRQIEASALSKMQPLEDWRADFDDPWRSAPGFAPGCRQVGAERWAR